MSAAIQQLPFERPVQEIERHLADLERTPDASPQTGDEIRRLRRERVELIKKIYSSLEPWETVLVARHPERPQAADYLDLVFDEFVELHGDRCFGDDRAMLTGFAKLDEYKVLFVGQQKGRNLKERVTCNYGCSHPEGYRKALRTMQLAAKFGMPVITLIDTPGAYPGVGAEERGQASVIATCIFELSRLGTPIIAVVIGEGGSGGALGIGVGDRVAIMQHAYYSVISPEGCAGILWKSGEYKEQAAKALKFTSRHLKEFGVVDDVLEEPLGGAHRDPHLAASTLKMYLVRRLRELTHQPLDQLVAARYEKFRRMGVFLEGGAAPAAAPTPAAAPDEKATPLNGNGQSHAAPGKPAMASPGS
jgi:acetyl-CoA carboxylase carboxyl transferase subunit alpha